MKDGSKIKYKPGPKSKTKDSEYNEEELLYSVMTNDQMSAADVDSNLLPSPKRRRIDTNTECRINDFDEDNFHAKIVGTENESKRKYKPGPKSRTKDSEYDEKELFYSVMTND